MRIKILAILLLISAYATAQFAPTYDTVKLYRGGQLYYLAIQNDTLFINGDTIIGVSANNLSDVWDSITVHRTDINKLKDTVALHLDTLQYLRADINNNYDSLINHRIAINQNIDTLTVHRTDIDAINPIVSFNTTNPNNIEVTFADGTIKRYSIAQAYPEYQLKITNLLKLIPSNTPTNAVLGMIYINQSDNRLYYYNGITWTPLDN